MNIFSKLMKKLGFGKKKGVEIKIPMPLAKKTPTYPQPVLEDKALVGDELAIYDVVADQIFVVPASDGWDRYTHLGRYVWLGIV